LKSPQRLASRLVLAALVLAIGLFAWDRTASNDSETTVVDHVTDGDTISVKISGRPERVRLIGIDTPETVDPNRPAGCFGKEASDYTKSLLPEGTEVELVLDVEPRDHFGRLLAYVYRASDGMFVNAEIAKGGYAETLTIPPNVTHTQTFTRLTAEARSQGKGLWSACGA
jgi:micrococcal nuclease